MEYVFEWDLAKEIKNIAKHGFSFSVGMEVFKDPYVLHLKDIKHSGGEERSYAVGKIGNGEVLTVRYVSKGNVIRIFGVARWRKWKRFYEKNTQPL